MSDERREDAGGNMPEAALTHDAFLGGRLWLWQPRTGYRAGVDAVLLAAFVPARHGDEILDLGCGVGAASLCLHRRVAGLTLTGVEREASYAALARRNAKETGARMNVCHGDVAAMPEAVRQRQFDHVMSNPPYFAGPGRVRSPVAALEAARGESLPLSAWVAAGARRLRPRGTLCLVQRAERLDAVLAALAAAQLGSVVVLPVMPRQGRDATLVLVRARKDGRAPLRLCAPLVMHEAPRHLRDGEDYTSRARAVLREAAPLTC